MDVCPICCIPLPGLGSATGDAYNYFCVCCGSYQLAASVRASLLNSPLPLAERSLVSHALRKMQNVTSRPKVDSDVLSTIRQTTTLPRVAEQAKNLLLWIGDKVRSPEAFIRERIEGVQAIIGAQTAEGAAYVARHVAERRLIVYKPAVLVNTEEHNFQMTFAGWEEYERLATASGESKNVFMAMKFNDFELDRVVEKVFRPAVALTGFKLVVLSDEPRAGLIDDRLRVEIRRSRFLIADVTHCNPGAYWEAGFAEGLGKTVIYTCKRDEFAKVAHFDTNHHLTVMWGEDLDAVADDLKATIRATLPAEAKLED